MALSSTSRISIVRWQPTPRRLPMAAPWLSFRRSGLSGAIPRRSFGGARSRNPRVLPIVRAGLAPTPPVATEEAGVLFKETFSLKRARKVEGKMSVRLDREEAGGSKWKLVVGCNLEGKWVLHWGVTYCGDFGSEWDQPPPEMRPPGSIPIKDYAIETPLKKSSSVSKGQIPYEVQISFDSSSTIAAIHFVLKEERSGTWFQHKGRDFRISLTNFVEGDDAVGGKQGFSIWPGAFDQISSLLLKPEGSPRDAMQQNRHAAGICEEYPIFKEETVQNFMAVTVVRSNDADKNIVQFDTDIPGDVVVHWGVCRGGSQHWEIPPPPHPPSTNKFRQNALQTVLQPKTDGPGNWGLFPVEKTISGVAFVLKLNQFTWLNNSGADFYIPLVNASILSTQHSSTQTANEQLERAMSQGMVSTQLENSTNTTANQGINDASYTDEIITEIRNLVTDISSEKGKVRKTKKAHENILQEIEKLAAEAYSIFRSSTPIFVEEAVVDVEPLKPGIRVASGTGTGYEILCQGFNWESHKSGRWYCELNSKVKEISSLGFTVVWLPPPTQSVSPEGYMPSDLYNLNSRYGSMEELKDLVKNFHEVGIKVLGDAVLNHRCAQYRNENGVWNIFGGRLNWDARAIVADDPHFQGKGNKSSGDNFHAAPNIDHSQDFVRKDLKEWLCWLREEVGYDGWRLDFVRGFWGGYVKDYMEATEPYFAVGEYWDSLSYTYGQMEHDQDAHRQRIIDWINAANGTAGAFDVTTKGILHSALEKCEYWRLSDQKGKPPGVLGWWPSRAVTFIENHDTGSTQGHWRFPAGKEMQGYAYILTHPGTPAVFCDHIFSHYREEISRLISVRNRMKIHCRSEIKITKAERDVYAAEIDEKVAVKIGPGHYEPPSGPKKWNVAAEGRDYKVWEAS